MSFLLPYSEGSNTISPTPKVGFVNVRNQVRLTSVDEKVLDRILFWVLVCCRRFVVGHFLVLRDSLSGTP